MKDETKDMIRLQLGLLKQTLKDENVAIAILVDKKDNEKSKLCFVDYEKYKQGTHDGFTIDLNEFNSQLD